RLGVRSDHQTILVAAGLARRPSRRVVESLVTPEFALRFRGEVAVHDAEDDGLVEVGEHEGMPLKAHRAVAESDVVVVISAAVTVLHGGPAALLAASSADAIRSASAESLLEAHLAPGWQLALALERAVRRRTPLIGVSLALDLHRRPADDAVPPSRAAERADRGDPRAGLHAPALAQRVPGAPWRHGRARQPPPPALRLPDPAALPDLLPGDAERAQLDAAARGGAGSG